MAKKETTLTSKEKLAQALVPEAEQLYKVPENWCWVRLGNLISTAKEKTESFDDPSVKYVGLENMEKDRGIVSLGAAEGIKSLKNVFSSGQILYGKLRPYLNKHDIAPFDGICSTDILVFDAKKTANKYYINYYFDTQSFIEYSIFNSKGINLPRVSEDMILQAHCPLSPLAEQQRIVDRIESLFSKLDEAKEKAQYVVYSFEDRKAAILHKVFTGELTEEWRKKNGLSRADWATVLLTDICTINPSKANTKDLPDDLEVSFYPMPALSEIYGEITEPQTRKLGEVRTGFTNFSEGDVVFAKITPCMENGKSAVIGPLVNNIGFGTTEFFVLRCGEKLCNRFLWHLMRDRSFRSKAKAVMSGAVGQQRVPKSFLENYPLSLPSIKEQIEIVRILDGLFSREQQAKEAAEQVIEQIDAMKKAILARAFRGALGTNDPDDESALELLKKVL